MKCCTVSKSASNDLFLEYPQEPTYSSQGETLKCEQYNLISLALGR